MKLVAGVDQNRTLALNEAAISESQLVRFIPDKQGIGLVQKLGGWTKWFPSNVGSTVRALWSWQDTNLNTYLALGSQSRTAVITALSNNIISATNYTTLSYSGAAAFSVGDDIIVSGVTPTSYNGTKTLTGATYDVNSSAGTVTFAGTDYGAMTVAGTFYAGDGLSEITSGNRQILTPKTQTQNVAVSATTTLNSPLVTITAAGSNVYSSDSVYIQTQISVGGLVLFGVYQATFINGTNQFQITARDVLGNPQNATSGTTGGAVPQFGYTSGSSSVSVTLANHGFQIGDTFPVLIPTTFAGITLYGNYTVTSWTSSSIFGIQANNVADSTTSVYLNGGNARFVYYKTPSALPTSTGYGIGGYGAGGYGTGALPTVSPAGDPIAAVDWTIDNWGQKLIACPVDGPIYTWDPTLGISQASIIPNAPPVNDGVFVAMPQRQIVAWGSTFNGVKDSLLIRWCDADNYDSWIASVTSQAGSYRFSKGSKIVGCIQGPQQGIVWTDLAVWAMQYVGPPYVYQFNEIGNGCGLIARKAATSMDGIVYWMSQSQFYKMGSDRGETAL